MPDDRSEFTVYICGPDSDARRTLAREVERMLSVQGMRTLVCAKTVAPGVPVTDPEMVENHFEQLRALSRLSPPEIRVKSATFPQERVQEILDREAEAEHRPAVLVRIHWEDNCFSDKILPERRYLVKCCDNAWYTGTFRLASSKLKPYWTFVEMDGRELLDNSPRRDLTREGLKSGILEVYEIVL